MTVLLWGRGVRLYDTLDEAVHAAMWASNSDNDWVDRLEVLAEGELPRIIEGTELYLLVGAKEAEWKASRPDSAPHVANVHIDDLPVESFYGDTGVGEAEALLARLQPLLGDRVKLRMIGADGWPIGLLH